MEARNCFSPYSLKLTIVIWWYLRRVITQAREDTKCIFMLLKPRLNTYGCVYGQTVILKKWITVTKHHLDQTMHLFTQNVHKVTGSNLTIQRANRIPRYCCPNHHRSTCMFHSRNQAFRTRGFLGRSPNTDWPDIGNNAKDDSSDHITYFHHWTSRFSDHHTIFLAF